MQSRLRQSLLALLWAAASHTPQPPAGLPGVLQQVPPRRQHFALLPEAMMAPHVVHCARLRNHVGSGAHAISRGMHEHMCECVQWRPWHPLWHVQVHAQANTRGW